MDVAARFYFEAERAKVAKARAEDLAKFANREDSLDYCFYIHFYGQYIYHIHVHINMYIGHEHCTVGFGDVAG